MFPNVSNQVNFPELECEMLDFWTQYDIFSQSLSQRKAEGKEYVFYDGPPFATGLPHYGHLLAGTIKSLVPSATLCPFKTSATTLKSSILPFVQVPTKTWST